MPGKIQPKDYGPSSKFHSIRCPHPPLCGPNGFIDILTDHMHEGECVVPVDLARQTAFDGYSSFESPLLHSVQAQPDVSADAVVTAHETDNTGDYFSGGVPANAKTFGAIGAYDGDPVDVGRVVVGSNLHHYVDIDLIGAECSSADPVKRQGFPHCCAVQAGHARIEAYYRNPAIWLARRGQRSCMLERALWAARRDPQLGMLRPRPGDDRLHRNDALGHGTSVRFALARLGSPCMSMDFFVAEEHPRAKYSWWVRLTLPAPPPPKPVDGLANPIEAGRTCDVPVDVIAKIPPSIKRRQRGPVPFVCSMPNDDGIAPVPSDSRATWPAATPSWCRPWARAAVWPCRWASSRCAAAGPRIAARFRCASTPLTEVPTVPPRLPPSRCGASPSLSPGSLLHGAAARARATCRARGAKGRRVCGRAARGAARRGLST